MHFEGKLPKKSKLNAPSKSLTQLSLKQPRDSPAIISIAIDYIHEMEKEKDNHEAELDSLKKEIMALKIMKW